MKFICIDTSVIVAIILEESQASKLRKVIQAHRCVISAASLLESHLVLNSRFGKDAAMIVDEFTLDFRLEVINFEPQHLEFGRKAFDKFGKGRHPAKLNFGDCLVYATAKLIGVPLLFLGDDFSKTDIESVAY